MAKAPTIEKAPTKASMTSRYPLRAVTAEILRRRFRWTNRVTNRVTPIIGRPRLTNQMISQLPAILERAPTTTNQSCATQIDEGFEELDEREPINDVPTQLTDEMNALHIQS